MRTLVNFKITCNLHHLILSKETGPNNELAKRLGISRTALFRTISYLRDKMWAPIIYDEQKKTYAYEYPPKFFISDGVLFALFGKMDSKDRGIGDESGEDDANDIEEDSMDDAEINLLFGAGNNEDSSMYPEDDDCDVVLDDDIDFNDLFPDE